MRKKILNSTSNKKKLHNWFYFYSAWLHLARLPEAMGLRLEAGGSLANDDDDDDEAVAASTK